MGATEIRLYGNEPPAPEFMDAVTLAWNAVYKDEAAGWGDAWIVGGDLTDYLEALGLRPGDRILYQGPDMRWDLERKPSGGGLL